MGHIPVIVLGEENDRWPVRPLKRSARARTKARRWVLLASGGLLVFARVPVAAALPLNS